MLTAFISDIHGNLPALQAAVAGAKKRGAARIVCAGDIVGYGPFPSEVCAYLQKSRITCISGNYDLKALNVMEDGKSAVAELQKKKRAVVMWTARHLDDAALDYLSGLPEHIGETLPNGLKLLVVHGSRIANDDDIYPSLTARGLEAKLGGVRPDILVCGHTHIPFVKRVGGVLVINCGSAGHPVDGDPRPSYALMKTQGNTAAAQIVRFKYDIEKTVAALRNTNLPRGLQKDFQEGTKRRFLQ